MSMLSKSYGPCTRLKLQRSLVSSGACMVSARARCSKSVPQRILSTTPCRGRTNFPLVISCTLVVHPAESFAFTLPPSLIVSIKWDLFPTWLQTTGIGVLQNWATPCAHSLLLGSCSTGRPTMLRMTGIRVVLKWTTFIIKVVLKKRLLLCMRA
jgi:hypothetical protein